MADKDITVISAIYGKEYMPFLGGFLESLYNVNIRRIDITCEGELYKAVLGSVSTYQFFDYRILPLIKRIEFAKEKPERAGHRIKYWAETFDSARGERVVFADVDTFFLKNPVQVFNSKFDIAYTTRPGKWPVNAGIVFARNTINARRFMSYWSAATETILRNPTEASDAAREFGAPDQKTMVQTIIQFKTLVDFKKLSCSAWNMTECTPEVGRVGIFHFKGCLPLLLKERLYGKKYGDERQPEICEPIFELWRGAYKKHMRRIG